MGKRSSIFLAAALSTLLGVMGCGSGENTPTAPVDTVAPAAVLDLEAGLGAGGIELNWAANAEPDLAGYNVYRSERGGPWALVSVEIAPTFRDGAVRSGSSYGYQVAAFDASRNESARVTSRVVGIPLRGGSDDGRVP